MATPAPARIRRSGVGSRVKLAACALSLFALSACGGGWTVTSAQRSLELGAQFTQEADEQLAPIVTLHVDQCDTDSPTREEFLECVEPYQPIRQGVQLARRTLTLGQSVVNAWRAGENQGSGAWMPIAACVGHGLGQVAGAIRILDLEVPGLLDSILNWVDAFGSMVSGVCPSSTIEEASRE